MSIYKFKIVRIAKMGKNFMIRIPIAVVKEIGLKAGDYLKIEWDSKKIILTKIE